MNELRNDFVQDREMTQAERDVWLSQQREWHDLQKELAAPSPYFKTVQHDRI